MLEIRSVHGEQESVAQSQRKELSSATAQRILAYLVEHPQAQDTLAGIMRWWLLEQEIRDWIDQVQKALDELVDQKLVLELRAKDGSTHYRINRRTMGKIKALLKNKLE
jgi:hypothetical protein